MNRAAPLNRGLVGWYKHLPNRLAGGGSSFLNLLAFDALVLNSGVSWSGLRPSGGYGSLLFNGTTGRIATAANAPRFSLTSTITAAAWVYPTSIASTRHYIHDYQNIVSGGWSTEILDSTGYKMRFTITGVATYTTASAVLVTNAWQHLVWVFDTTANTITFYVNGKRVDQATSVGDAGSATIPFGIGCRSALASGVANDRFFSGSLDDVRVSSIAMTDAQVAALFRASIGGYLNEFNWQSRPVIAPEQAASGNRRRRYIICGAAA